MTPQLKLASRRRRDEVLEQTVKTSDSDVTELSASQLVEVIDGTPSKRPPATVPDPPRLPTALSVQALKPATELPLGSIVGETYEVEARLGSGSMGEVYAARHVKLDKRVAIKVIGPRAAGDDSVIERFAREARTLAKIQHPAIVAVEHVGELADGRAYFVMEYLHGESLFERLLRGRVPLPEALRILDQMARGLEAAHAQGVVHRDLKPDNTFLVHLSGEPPIIKLLDFGLAKLKAAADHVESTQRGMAIGTPKYMSPEQSSGADVDHRADVYALGCVAYELMLDQAPFPHARTTPQLFAAHLCEAPLSPRSIWPEIPPQLERALSAMLAKEPGNRPTLAKIRSVLSEVSAAVNPAARHASAEPRAKARPKNLVTTTVGSLVVLVGSIAIGTALAVKRTPTAPAHIAPLAAQITPAHTATPAAPPLMSAAVDLEPRAIAAAGTSPTGAEEPQPPLSAPQEKRLAASETRAPRRRGTGRESRPNASRQVQQAPKDQTPTNSRVGTFDAYIEKDPQPPPPSAIEEPSRPRLPPKSEDTPRPPAVDKNQTVNPFAKKHNVNP